MQLNHHVDIQHITVIFFYMYELFFTCPCLWHSMSSFSLSTSPVMWLPFYQWRSFHVRVRYAGNYFGKDCKMLGSFGVSHGVQAILFANLHDDNARFALCSQSLFCSHRLLREELWSERLRLWRWCRHSTDELTRLTFLSHMSSNLLCTFEFCLHLHDYCQFSQMLLTLPQLTLSSHTTTRDELQAGLYTCNYKIPV